MRLTLKTLFTGYLLLGLTALSAMSFIADEDGSPHSSSKSFISFQNQFQRLQDFGRDRNRDWLIRPGLQEPKSIRDYGFWELLRQSSASKSGLICYSKMLLRYLEKTLIWLPVNYMTMLLQHEVFGHGYRIRQLGEDKVVLTGYRFNSSGTSTQFGMRGGITPSDSLAICIAGSEANSILATNLEKAWLSKGFIDGRQVSLWFLTQGDLPRYVKTLKKESKASILAEPFTGNDAASYLAHLNILYGSSTSVESQIKDLIWRGRLSRYFNPFTYLSILADAAHTFLNTSIPVPGLPVASFKFLPVYQLGFTPFGPENIYRGYFFKERASLTTVYIREGSFSKNYYIGLGVENQALFKTKFGHIGAKLDLWHQPRYLERPLNIDGYEHNTVLQNWVSQANPSELEKRRAGAAVSLFYKYPFTKSDRNNLWFQIGYKTKGYLPGEALGDDVIARFGLQIGF